MKGSRRPANPKGVVFIAEWHRIGKGKNSMVRSPEAFRKDLERLYRLGFRPCTVSDYLAGRFPIPAGTSPVVMTFDGSHPSQFALRPDGTTDPNCAIGIWREFSRRHPDFPVRATFYVLPDVMWGQPKLRAKKLAMLKEWGCELGNHTVTHPILRRLSDEQVRAEI